MIDSWSKPTGLTKRRWALPDGKRKMRIVGLAVMILLGTGCGDSVDPSRLLIGRWGTGTAELIALRSGAELHLHVRPGCMIVVFGEPLELMEGNAFEAQGEIWTSDAAEADRPQATIAGLLDGDAVQLQVALGAEWFPLALEAGVAPDPGQVAPCPP